MRYYLLPFFLFNFVFAQDFEESKTYQLTDVKSQIDTVYLNNFSAERPAIKTHLVKRKDTLDLLVSFNVQSGESFETATVSEMVNPKLKGVKSVLKVEIEYVGCCSVYESYYFLITNKNELLEIPMIEWASCDWPENRPAYLSPNQEGGKEGAIVLAGLNYNMQGELDSISTKNVLLWDGKQISVQ
jgi:hypothetical protein